MNFYDYNITSPYGTRTDPIDGTTKHHNGIDYALPLNTEVQSNIKGVVQTVQTDPSNSYGIYVDVFDGLNYHRYAHLNSTIVKVGQKINVNDVLGLSGSTGRSTGAHLHYEVKSLIDGSYINPSNFIKSSHSDSFSNTGSILGTQLSSTGQYGEIEQISFKNKIKGIIFNIFKFIIIALLIVLFVLFITKSLDISII